MKESKVWLREHSESYKLEKPRKSMTAVCSNSKSLFVGVMLAACLQLTGINVIMFFAPSILKKISIFNGNARLILLLNLGIGVWNSITTLIAVGLVEKAGRKTLIILGTIILTLALFLCGAAGLLPEDSDSRVIIIAIGLALFLLGFEVGPGCLFWVLINEVFDPDVREQANGFINLLQWGFNLIVLSTYPFLFRISDALPFFLYGGIGVLVIIALQISLPNSHRKSESYDEF